MKYTVLLFLFSTLVIYSPLATAQQQSTEVQKPDRITISSSGEALAPADIASMSISISIQNESAEYAFELHKERETFLAGLLKELDFEDEQINYQPVGIRPNRQRDGAIHSSTFQQIRLELQNIEMLSTLQMTLIENEFDNFSGTLSSTKLEEAANEALRLAVSNARLDAEILAEASGRTLGKIISIDHASDQSFRPGAVSETLQVRAMGDAGPSMFDFSQTVSVQKRVTIVFELSDQ